MLGVSTIGNATLVAYDETPILTTDPWFGDEFASAAYFGSWGLSHRIPADVKRDILNSKFIWFSHGHPDHLNGGSLAQLRGKQILLPDHVGGRIVKDLSDQGFDVTVLPDRRWVDLSPRIRVFCITTLIQDGILLVEVNGRLFVNLNDAGTQHCALLLKKIAAGYSSSYLLQLSSYGDADMINFHDESGVFVDPGIDTTSPIGWGLSSSAHHLGLRSVVPFSSFHSYQRTDSVWAQDYAVPLEAYSRGFDHRNHEFIPPYSFIDCATGVATPTNPPATDPVVFKPEDFGDCWSDELEPGDREKIQRYFEKKDIVRDGMSFINFRVGGRDNFIKLDGKQDRGITFNVPRNSLMTAINYEIFDDLLIGNFMKTTLHNMNSLYERIGHVRDGSFNFAVTKFADNGGANTYREVDAYLREYKRRAGADWYYHRFYEGGLLRYVGQATIKYAPRDSSIYRLARKVYRSLR